MLDGLEKEKEAAEGKISEATATLKTTEANLKEVMAKIDSSPALQVEQALREEYLEIRSRLQTEHAQIERETCKLDSQIQQLLPKQISALNDLKKVEA